MIARASTLTAAMLEFTVEVVREIQGQSGFPVRPRRWVMEHTFAWMIHWRRLVRLRGPPRRIRNHDLHRNGEPAHPKDHTLNQLRNGL